MSELTAAALVDRALLAGDHGRPLIRSPLLNDILAWDASDSHLGAFVVHRRAGKSTGAAVLAARNLLARPGSLTVWVSGTEGVSGDILEQKLRRPLSNCEPLRGLDLQLNRGGELRNDLIGSSIKILPHSEAAAVGRSVDLLIVDEPRDVADEVFEKLRPSAACGKTLVIGNPGPPDGWFYALTQDVQPGCWVRSYSGIQNPTLPPGFVEAERRRLYARGEWGRLVFAREWLGEWVRIEENPLMLPELVEACERPAGHADLAPSPGEELFFLAADLSLVADLTSIICLAVNPSRADRPYRVCETIVLDPKSFPSRTIPLEHVQKMISAMAGRYGPLRISIDRYQGEQLCQALQREGLPIVSIQPTAELNFRAFSRLRDAIHQRRILWPRDERLRNELLNLALTETPSGFKVIDSRKRFHRDVSFSLALALDSAITLLGEHCPVELLG